MFNITQNKTIKGINELSLKPFAKSQDSSSEQFYPPARQEKSCFDFQYWATQTNVCLQRNYFTILTKND